MIVNTETAAQETANKSSAKKWLAMMLRALFIGYVILGTIMAIGVAAYAFALPYLPVDGPIHSRLLALPRIYLMAHTFGGGVALLLVPLQFWLVKRHRGLHRLAGRLYVLAIIISSLGGYVLAVDAFGGLISTIGLTLLASLWWSFTLLAMWHAIQGRYALHREWMIRSIALTTAAITLRLMSPALHMNLDPVTAQQTLYWVSWLFNLAVAEWWIRRPRNVIRYQSLVARASA